MKNSILLALLLIFTVPIYSQEQKNSYDEALAKSLHADEDGMKNYVFCLLKAGNYTAASKDESQKLFKGHMATIYKLAQDKKLIITGSFMPNEKNYMGIFIFNVETIAEAEALVVNDPAIKAHLIDIELIPWVSSAALQEVTKIHPKIAKTKF
ncbi:YciI family protein [Flavobacterium agrisoli]|uniref:YCII-related domain-containing protein n=1 Tax=Flavobacterium agrisoli TaxID=2793066 RepID=A0A934UJ78_9FLAO|nr:YciI family protein [Flavobacterium agrisoli]MBK0369198.1 hypothetical protein [Flavobacterium agrisoli]